MPWMTVRFRIVGIDMPGSECTRAQGFEVDRTNVHVGLQAGADVVDLVRGDAGGAQFEIDVPVKVGRLSGPFVHGQGGERFLYLSWGDLEDDGAFTMFRRAKIHLDTLDAVALEGKIVEGLLKMTDAAGGPVCASVRPPVIRWTERPS
jgi:Family of unknown function (DUF5990)